MGMNILHIDDSPEICQLYSDYYSQKNHNITSETDARKGLELVLENDYDIILLDMCMPQYDGMKFLHDLEQKKPSELRKIIVTSALSFDEKQTKDLKKFGIRSVKEKPSHIQKLESLMKGESQKDQNKEAHQKKMLIIDDNPDTTKMLSEFFQHEGYETLMTNDPMEGLQLIRHGNFDVILLDLAMPRVSGFEIIASLATEDILSEQNIFIYSANLGSNLQINELLRKDGVKGCLKKPMSLPDMLTAITEKTYLQQVHTA
jgi:CheY-like chemotaxis protein